MSEETKELTGIEAAKARISEKRKELGGGDLTEDKADDIQVVKNDENVIVADDKSDVEEEVLEEEDTAEVVEESEETDAESEELVEMRDKYEKTLKKLNDEDGKRGASMAQTTALNAKLMNEIEELKKSAEIVVKTEKAEDITGGLEDVFDKLPDSVKEKWEKEDVVSILELVNITNNDNSSSDRIEQLEAKLRAIDETSSRTEAERWFDEVEQGAKGFKEAQKSDLDWANYLQEPAIAGIKQTRAELLNEPNATPEAAINVYKAYKASKGESVEVEDNNDKKPEKRNLSDISSPRSRSSKETQGDITTTITKDQYERYRRQAASANGDEQIIKNWKVAKKLKAEGNVI